MTKYSKDKSLFRILNVIKNNAILIIMCICLSLKEILFDFEILNHISKKAFLIDSLIIIFIFEVLVLIFKQKYKLPIFIIYSLISFLMFSNSIFYKCYQEFITLGIFNEIGQISNVKTSILFFFDIKDILYIIDLPVIILIMYKSRNNYKKASIVRFVTTLFLIILIFVYTNAQAQKGWFRDDLYRAYGFITATAIDYTNYIKNNIQFSKISSNEKQLINDKYKGDTGLVPKYKGKNLIMIQVESLQQFVINRKYNGQEITPNINKLLSESLYFDNCYYQTSLGHTADAELLTNTSLYPLANSAVYMTKFNNSFISIPDILDQNGYITLAIHGNEASFWNRGTIYVNYGFNKFYSLEKLKNDDILNMGLSDKSLLAQSFNIIKNSKQPFYSFIITLSSHAPFNVPNNFCKADDNLSRYYNAINYVDKQLGKFIENLKSSGILNNSILVLYGDHNAITIGDKNNLQEITAKNLDMNYNWKSYQKVPMIIRFPNEDKKVYSVKLNYKELQK